MNAIETIAKLGAMLAEAQNALDLARDEIARLQSPPAEDEE